MPDLLLEAVNPVLPSRDVKAAIQFYVDKLDFTLSFQDAEDPRYASIIRDRVEIHLRWHDPSSWDRVERPNIRIAVCDVEHLFSVFQPLGIFASDTTLRDTAFGTREFGFFDPDGNLLTFYSDLGE